MWHEWIEAVATAAGVLVNAVTLWVLIEYARDTKRLAKTSIKQVKAANEQAKIAREQLENSQTPFVVQFESRDTPRGVIYRIENEGSGPAMNVASQVEWSNGAKAQYGPYCLSKEGFVEFEGAPGIIHTRIDYASLSGRKYVTEMTPLGVKAFTRL